MFDTPDQQIVPDEPTTNNPTASEIADMVLSGELDMSKWHRASSVMLSNAFLDLIGIITSYKYDNALNGIENRSELLSEMLLDIREKIEFWAERECEGKEAGMSTLL